MTLIRCSVALFALAALLSACDDPPKSSEAEKPSAAATDAKAVPPPTAAPIVPPVPLPVAPPQPQKKPAECSRAGTIEFDQPGLEDEIRRKLQKPEGTLSAGDLSRVHSLNLAQAKRTGHLDTCTLMRLSGLKDL